jgi:hypothetical protein
MAPSKGAPYEKFAIVSEENKYYVDKKDLE